MKADSKKGFLYQQSLLMRLVYISVLFLIVIIVTYFLIPVELIPISFFASGIFGTLVGTYLANFVFKSSEVIDEQGDSLVDAVKDTVEKGKEFIENLEAKDSKIDNEANIEAEIETEVKPEAPKKSARQRLKDKGHL